MANLNYIIEFSFSFCTKCCTYVWENVNLNTEIHCHFTYCIAILHITLQIEFCYTYASIDPVKLYDSFVNRTSLIVFCCHIYQRTIIRTMGLAAYECFMNDT